MKKTQCYAKESREYKSINNKVTVTMTLQEKRKGI